MFRAARAPMALRARAFSSEPSLGMRSSLLSFAPHGRGGDAPSSRAPMVLRARASSSEASLGMRSSLLNFTPHGRGGDASSAPLTIFCGWMGATERQMGKYLELWHERGCNTATFAVGPQHVLFPERGQRFMEEVMGTVRADLVANGRRPVVLHFMSVGGYLFGQWIRSLRRDGAFDAGRPDPLLGCLTAQIFDSPPDFNGIADGVSQSMGIGGVRELLLKTALAAYLRFTRDGAGVQHREASAAFHANPVRVPALWYYSTADRVRQNPRVCPRVCPRAPALGADATTLTANRPAPPNRMAGVPGGGLRARRRALARGRDGPRDGGGVGDHAAHPALPTRPGEVHARARRFPRRLEGARAPRRRPALAACALALGAGVIVRIIYISRWSASGDGSGHRRDRVSECRSEMTRESCVCSICQ